MLKFLHILELVIFIPSRIVLGVALFLRSLRFGIYYGYPLCCNLNFSLGYAFGPIKHGLRRGGVHITEEKVYVPCRYHKGKHPCWVPHSQDPRVERYRKERASR